MVDISNSLEETCSDLRRQFKQEDMFCLNCDVTDQNKLV